MGAEEVCKSSVSNIRTIKGRVHTKRNKEKSNSDREKSLHSTQSHGVMKELSVFDRN